MDHQTLLAEYTRNGSDAAFRELVTRYVDLVFSTALRLVEGDTHRAEDVVQTVFVDLARVARTLPADVKLGGWLHRDTCFVATTLMRGERRRQARERQAVEMNALQNHSEADYSQIAPLLDEAINELDEADRTAILLRFFEQQDFRAVGQALGSNENAARMRVTRALEKLEVLLKRRGVTTSAASLGVVLTANAVQAAPVGLVVTISTAAALAGATANIATQSAMNWINIKSVSAIVAAAIVAATGTHLVQQREATRLRNENQNLIAEKVKLTNGRDATLSAVAANKDEIERLQKNQNELLRLRGEIGALRRQAQELERVREENRQLHASLAKESPPPQQPERDSKVNPFAAAKMNDAKKLVLALIMFADDNSGQFPAHLNQTSNLWVTAKNTNVVVSDSTEFLTQTNNFELVYYGSLNNFTNMPSALIAVREKEASLLDGKWVKAYGFLDGHAELKSEPPEGFEAWEKQHIIESPRPSP